MPSWIYMRKEAEPSDACLRYGEERRRSRAEVRSWHTIVTVLSLCRFWKVRRLIWNPEKKEMFENGTHFNPVDLVCAVRDYKGHKFNLANYVDQAIRDSSLIK